MRWLGFVILAVAVATIQTTVAGRAVVFGGRPDFCILLVVFLALHGARRDALVACWLLGMLADLMTIERLGLLAVLYTLVAGAILAVREFVYARHFLTHFAMTFLAVAAAHSLLALYRVFRFGPSVSSYGGAITGIVAAALLTGLLAPPLHAFLLRFARSLGLSEPRYSHTGLRRMGQPHV